MNLQIGQTLGKYRIEAFISQGGMGEVYRASHTMLGHVVAIKFLAPHLAQDSLFVQRFLLEAKTMVKLRHSNIVQVLDADQQSGLLYFVMEYLEGGTLTEQMSHPVPVERAIEWLSQVAQALDYAHSQNFVHRDLKPSNILLDRHGHLKIVDFGIVKEIAQTIAQKRGLTPTHQILGTPSYMAPEQFQGGVITPQTDLYALGIIAYKLFTGQVPFQGSITQVMYGHVNLPPTPPRQLNPSLPPAAEEVLLKVLAKEPQNRYSTATAFVEALRAALLSSNPQLPQPASTRWWPWAVGGAALGLFIICSALLFIVQRIITPQIVSTTPTATEMATTVTIFTATPPTRVPSSTATDIAVATSDNSPQMTPSPTIVPPEIGPLASQFRDIRQQVSGTGGLLPHTEGEFVQAYYAEVELGNFWVEASFTIPYATTEGDWSIGYLFRDQGPNQEFRLSILSKESWELKNHSDDADGTRIGSGLIREGLLNLEPDELNEVALIAHNDQGELYINDELVALLDLSLQLEAGDVAIATGIEGEIIEGQETHYRDFSIWKLPD